MKSIFQTLLLSWVIWVTQISSVFAAEDNQWLLQWVKDATWSDGKTVSAITRIRTWDLHLDDIPNVIHSLITIFISLAGTVSVIFVIVWAYKLLFGSLTWDPSKWKATIIMALTGFVISIMAWFIVKLIFNNFG